MTTPSGSKALRARLLTREVLELPHTLAMFAEEMREFKAHVDLFVESANRRFNEIDTRFDAVDARLDGHDARFDAVDASLERHEVMLKRITDDLGQLKGAHARNAALEDASSIARELGLRRTKTLTQDDLWDLIDAADTANILGSDLRSFRVADLIMEATAQAGEICYVAVEISYTANGIDTSRAIRNAEFLTRFTGKRSFAACIRTTEFGTVLNLANCSGIN
jgi:hypothetical protein